MSSNYDFISHVGLPHIFHSFFLWNIFEFISSLIYRYIFIDHLEVGGENFRIENNAFKAKRSTECSHSDSVYWLEKEGMEGC